MTRGKPLYDIVVINIISALCLLLLFATYTHKKVKYTISGLEFIVGTSVFPKIKKIRLSAFLAILCGILQLGLGVFFIMLFNGGLVPSYIMWTQVFHVKNTVFALIFPTLLMNGFIIMLLRSNFQSNIHPALIEAAKIDGAGELLIYRKIILPLSLPILATAGLMVGIGYWNDWMNGLYYISDNKLYSLQQLLNNILNNIKALASMSSSVTVTQEMPSIGIRMAMAVIGVVPIMVLYPFFQKSFVKGIAIGGVKE